MGVIHHSKNSLHVHTPCLQKTHTHPSLGPRHSRPTTLVLLILIKPSGFFRPAEGQGTSAVCEDSSKTEWLGSNRGDKHKDPSDGYQYFLTTGPGNSCSCNRKAQFTSVTHLLTYRVTYYLERGVRAETCFNRDVHNHLCVGGRRACCHIGMMICLSVAAPLWSRLKYGTTLGCFLEDEANLLWGYPD